MSTVTAPPLVLRNHILKSLPRQNYQLLFSGLHAVQLDRGQIVYELAGPIRSAFFVTSGMVSLLATTEDGSATQVAMIGDEGVLGLPALLGVDKAPFQVMVQIPGQAMRIKIDVLEGEFRRAGPLQDILLRYLHCLISQISQSAACNRFHTVEQRLSRWLLTAHDKVKPHDLVLTQEMLAHMLGAPRTNVTKAAATLKRTGVIQYRRTRIRVLDRPALERLSCECYGFIMEEIGCYVAA